MRFQRTLFRVQLGAAVIVPAYNEAADMKRTMHRRVEQRSRYIHRDSVVCSGALIIAPIWLDVFLACRWSSWGRGPDLGSDGTSVGHLFSPRHEHVARDGYRTAPRRAMGRSIVSRAARCPGSSRFDYGYAQEVDPQTVPLLLKSRCASHYYGQKAGRFARRRRTCDVNKGDG